MGRIGGRERREGRGTEGRKGVREGRKGGTEGGGGGEKGGQTYFIEDSSPNVFRTAAVNFTWKETYSVVL